MNLVVVVVVVVAVVVVVVLHLQSNFLLPSFFRKQVARVLTHFRKRPLRLIVEKKIRKNFVLKNFYLKLSHTHYQYFLTVRISI